ATQTNGSEVHDLKLLVQHFIISQKSIFLSVLVNHWVGAVNTVNLGGLEHQICVHLNAAQAGRRIGGKERIASACGKDHHLAPTEGTNRLAAIVVIDNTRHGNG